MNLKKTLLLPVAFGAASGALVNSLMNLSLYVILGTLLAEPRRVIFLVGTAMLAFGLLWPISIGFFGHIKQTTQGADASLLPTVIMIPIMLLSTFLFFLLTDSASNILPLIPNIFK